MAQKPDGKSARTERVTFTKPAAERIAKVVRAVEGGDRDTGPLSFGNRGGGGSSGKAFRVCTFTGAWSINATKTVTFKNQTATPNTVAAVNLFCGLNPSGSCDVSIAKEGTAWYLVQPNVTQLPGYSASGTQVMVIVSGNLRFIGTTAC
jgi:hypothetical protein